MLCSQAPISASVPPLNIKAGSKWYAVFTAPRHEKRVRQHFEKRGIESFLPTYYSTRRWNNGCKVKIELPLFPSYVFVHVESDQRIVVMQVPGVLTIVGSSRGPSALEPEEIAGLRAAIECRKINPHPQPAIGQRVRVVSGQFVGTEGVLERMNGETHVVLTLRTIQQGFSMQVDADEIELIRDSENTPRCCIGAK